MRNTNGAAYAASKYIEIPVREESTLLDFLLKQMGISRNRAKDLLSGKAITVDRKLVTRHDTPLHVGEVVRVSRHRQSTMLENKYVKIVYEDKDIVVIEKSEGILSMASSPKQYCVKNVLDEYFEKRHFKCTAHVVHRLDRETSGLMIYAKNVDVARILEDNWHDMVYDRRYVALLCGKMATSAPAYAPASTFAASGEDTLAKVPKPCSLPRLTPKFPHVWWPIRTLKKSARCSKTISKASPPTA